MEASIGNIVPSSQTNGNVIVQSTRSILSESFYFQDFYDDARVAKFEKSIKQLVRSSREYTAYIGTLKANCPILNFDDIQSHIDGENCSLEMHHYPFTLEDIVEIVFCHHVTRKDNMTSFSIAKEIMEQHYLQHIGLVPLTKTNHELAHTGDIFLSEKQIYGNWRQFMADYSDGISADLRAKIKRLDDLSEKSAATDYRHLFE